MQRTTLQTVARRRAALATARTFSSSSKCAEEGSKTRPEGSPAPARRIPMASSLGDITLPSGKFKIHPAAAPGSNYRPDLSTWASDTDNTGRVSFSQRHAQRRMQALDNAEGTPSFESTPSSTKPQPLPLPQSNNLASNQIPAPSSWVKPKTPEERRAEMLAKWKVDAEKEKTEQRARAAAAKAEAQRRKKLHEARQLEVAKAAKEREQLAIEARQRQQAQKEKLKQESEARRQAEWYRLQAVQLEEAREEMRAHEAILKSAPRVVTGPVLVTPEVARKELESLIAPKKAEAASDAPPSSSEPAQLDSVLATRIQSLKERAGDYSSYLPPHYGVGRAPGQEHNLGPVAYAQLALARSRGTTLVKRRGAVQIVEKFANSKEIRANA